MAYADAWNVTDPAGSEQAKNIDDHIRKLRSQIDERMEDVLVVDFAADPLVLQDEIKGAKTGKTLTIHASAIIVDTSAALDIIDTGRGIQITDIGIMAVSLPAGVTVTKVEVIMNKRGNSSCDWSFIRTPFSAVLTSEATGFSSVISTAGITVSSVEDEHIITTDYYYMFFGATASAHDIYAVRITYDAPNSTNTI